MACGCTAACGCTVVGENGIAVRRIGDSFRVSLSGSAAVIELLADDAVIDPATTHVVYDGAAGAVLELPPALEGMLLEVWNYDDTDDVNVAAAAGETVNDTTDIDVPSRYVGRFLARADGDWIGMVS